MSAQDKPLRILMMTYTFGPRFGGAERQAALLAEALMDRGHHVEYLCAGEGPKVQHDHHGRIRVARVPGFAKGPMRPLSVWTRFLWSASQHLLAQKDQWDLIHCHGAFDPSSLVLSLLRKKLNTPILLKHASGREYQILRRHTWLPEEIAQKLHARLDGHVSNNREIAQKLPNQQGLDARTTRYIPNGVLLPEACAPRGNESPQVLCVSNFNQGKNQIALVRAWPEVLRRVPNARLTFAGTGKEQPLCKEEAQKLGVADKIEFKDFVKDVPALLQTADLFAFPSRHPEGMPNAILEAMAAGLPCVVLAQPAVNALVRHEEEGISLDKDDPVSFAEAIAQALTHGDTYAAQSRSRAQDTFSMPAVAARYEELYRELIR